MYDFIIKNGLIVDGTGKKPFLGNLYVKNGKIEKICSSPEADSPDVAAKKIYDADGHVVAPGFINIHSHSDNSYLKTPTYESMLDGGVTFELCGQCGLSSVPVKDALPPMSGTGLLQLDANSFNDIPKDMAEYAKTIDNTGISINVGMMLGHGALRAAVVGFDQRDLTEDEMEEMCRFLDKELKAGAMGVSLGLIYAPGSFCSIDEIKAMARVCAANDKVLAVHVRNENRYVFEAVKEMLDVAGETGVRLEISHLKLMGKTMWGRAGELLALIDMARAKGVCVHCDQYVYDASNSALVSSFPKEALDGGLGAFVKNLEDDDFWNRISGNGKLPELEFRGGVDNITVNEISGIEWPEIMGKSLTQIAELLGKPVGDALRELLIKCGGQVNCIYHNMSMDDVITIASRRDICVISDGTAFDLNDFGGCPHPRNCGSFPRFLRFVREKELMPIEDAVYKMTGLPSAIMGTDDRFGFLKEGLDATITVFDKDTITDHATYDEPNLKNEGIDYVFVNGEKVLDHGIITDARPGKCIVR